MRAERDRLFLFSVDDAFNQQEPTDIEGATVQRLLRVTIIVAAAAVRLDQDREREREVHVSWFLLSISLVFLYLCLYLSPSIAHINTKQKNNEQIATLAESTRMFPWLLSFVGHFLRYVCLCQRSSIWPDVRECVVDHDPVSIS